jgi:hypothetical protein
MNAGFKRIEPGMDIGVDLSEEWGMAERVCEGQDPIPLNTWIIFLILRLLILFQVPP